MVNGVSWWCHGGDGGVSGGVRAGILAFQSSMVVSDLAFWHFNQFNGGVRPGILAFQSINGVRPVNGGVRPVNGGVRPGILAFQSINGVRPVNGGVRAGILAIQSSMVVSELAFWHFNQFNGVRPVNGGVRPGILAF